MGTRARQIHKNGITMYIECFPTIQLYSLKSRRICERNCQLHDKVGVEVAREESFEIGILIR